MNIQVPYKWLNQIVNTKLTAQKAAELITLRSSSVEKIDKIEGDEVLDIEITPNRGDNLSILGIAREFYAICKAEGIDATFNDIFKNILNTSDLKIKDTPKPLKINILDKNANPRFTAIVVSNVKVTKSPKYIQDRLIQCGMRPINNIVDLTNYTMLLTGQPMHAFDYNKIGGGVMNVRTSKKGESITTLDGIKRDLPLNSVVIEDNSKIIDLCGIMGGENSAIDNNTNTVVLFTQIYDKYLLRKTSLTLNHRTDAVQRFEKGLDPLMQDKALLLSLSILKESTNYDISSQFYDINNTNVKTTKINLPITKLKMYANTNISLSLSKSILQALGFKIVKATNTEVQVEIPSYRMFDVSIDEDLIEEVIRIYGYEKIGLELPSNYFDTDILNNTNKVERLLKNHLKSAGFNELLTISMVSGDKVNKKIAVKIDNPLGADMEYLRTSQQPILKDAIVNNKQQSVSVFELSKVYKLNGDKLPIEQKKLAILSNSKNSDEQLLNTIKNLFTILNICNYKIKQVSNNKLNIIINKKLSGKILIDNNYSYAQILFKNLVKNYLSYPKIADTYNTNIFVEDLTIHVPINFMFIDLVKKIENIDKNIVEVGFKDSFIKQDKKALTVSIKYQNKLKDLTEKEVTVIRNNVIKFIENTIKFTVDKPKDYEI